MSKAARCFLKGVGIGLLLGSISGASGYCYMRRNKRGVRRGVRRGTAKAIRSIGCIVEDLISMF